MIALHPFAELAACRLLLVLLIGIFAPRALKRKHNTCNTRRSTARSAPQPQVTAKLRCALFMGLLRTMEGAFLDKASLQGALAEWHNNQATSDDASLNRSSSVSGSPQAVTPSCSEWTRFVSVLTSAANRSSLLCSSFIVCSTMIVSLLLMLSC